MRIRMAVMAGAIFTLATGTAAFAGDASSGNSGASNSTGAGGASLSGGRTESSVSIHIDGPGSVGSVQGAVAGGGSASGSSNSSSGAGSTSSGSEGAATGASSPSTVDGGVVSTSFDLPALELDSQPASRSSTPLLTWVGVALIVVGFTALYFRLPYGRSA